MSENALTRALPDAPAAPSAAGSVSLELVLYAVLLALAVALRLLSLDVPPRPEEVPNMLAAWRNATSISPALFWAQSLSFDLLGGSIVSARLLTAIAGIVLAASPLAFRAELGRTRAVLFTLLLTVSAPLTITARSASPAVWTLLFGLLALRLWMNHVATPGLGRGIRAVVATAALLLLGDPSGVVLALMLVAGTAVALVWRAATAESDVEAGAALGSVRAALAQVTWDKSVAVAALVVAAVASGFMTAPSGLSNVGGLLGGIGALFQPDGDNMFAVSVFYQLLLWVLAVAAILYNRSAGWSAADRFFAGWLVAGLVAAFALPGLGPQHTIYLALPLCGLVSGLAAACFAPDRHQTILAEKYAAKGDELAMLMSPPAGRLILMVIVFALLFIFNVHLGATSREVLFLEDSSIAGAIARMQANAASPDFRVGLLWSFISFMFLLVGYFLAGSIWGNRVAGQGYGLGFLAMLIVSQLSGGWYVSVENAESPVEPWHFEATTHAYGLLERSLNDLSFREAQSFPLLPITVLRSPATGATEDGLLGWLLRDYPNVRWVDTLAEAATNPIIIAPDAGPDAVQPNFGGSYVGQPFAVTKVWSPETMGGLDFVTWFLQRNVRIQPSPRLDVTLWVRQDVFDSRPIEDLLD